MARGRKKEKKELTPEERLQNALVPKEEWPYELPEGWKWVRIGGISDLYNGRAFKPTDWTENGLPIVRIQNLNDQDAEYNYYSGTVEERYALHGGELLFAWSGTPGTSFGAHIWWGKEAVLNQHIFKMIFDENILNKRYFMYAINQQLNQLISVAHGGAGLQHVTKGVFENTPIPLPDLVTQEHIVTFIDNEFRRLDEAKDQIQSVLDGSEERKQSILHKAFTGKLTARWRIENSALYQETSYFADVEKTVSGIKKKKIKKVFNPFEDQLKGMIPEEWHLKNLDSISRQITDGEHATPRRVDNYCGYYLLSARNVRNDYLQLNDVDYVDEDEYKRISSRCNPKRGDVLISCSGSVGRVCVINDDNQYCMVRSAAMVSAVQCNPRFVMYMLQSPEVQQEIKELSKQTAQANLFLGAIATLLIPLPVIEEQNEIVQILDSYSANDNEMFRITEQVNDQIEEEKQSLLSKALRGELKI